jgi:hypothetical protein
MKTCVKDKYGNDHYCEDLTGQKFGRLTVISLECSANKQSMWHCKCDCGNETVVRRNGLISGRIKSCGCYSKDYQRQRFLTHGMTDTRIYNIYKGAKLRCTVAKPKNRKYIGRGITMCDRWLESFENFYEDMSEEYYRLANAIGEDNVQLDRIDNDGNYCPENCRWTNRRVQMNNKTDTHYLLINGEKISVTEAYRKYAYYDITRPLFNNRFYIHGWDFEKSILTHRMDSFAHSKTTRSFPIRPIRFELPENSVIIDCGCKRVYKDKNFRNEERLRRNAIKPISFY